MLSSNLWVGEDCTRGNDGRNKATGMSDAAGSQDTVLHKSD